MGLREQLAEHRPLFDAVLRVATCRESLGFADLTWPPFDLALELPRLLGRSDLGVYLQTQTRYVVVERVSDELRYYAGGCFTAPDRLHEEADRVEAEGCEMGVFATPRDVLLFLECFLLLERAVQDIATPRLLRHQTETTHGVRP